MRISTLIFATNGSTGTEVGATQLNGADDIQQFRIQGSTVVVPGGTENLGFWRYPAGGYAKKTISLSLADDATVSLAHNSSESR